jgi:hypothetical protein
MRTKLLLSICFSLCLTAYSQAPSNCDGAMEATSTAVTFICADATSSPVAFPRAVTAEATTVIRIGVLADSIWASFSQVLQDEILRRVNLTPGYSATLTYQDARPGRQFQDALECYGGLTGTSPSLALGVYNSTNPLAGSGTTAPIPTCGQFNTVSAPQSGSSLAQNLADVDVLIVALGTNDMNDGGSPKHQQPGDPNSLLAPVLNQQVSLASEIPVWGSSNTQIGSQAWVLSQLHSANPAMHILMVTTAAHVWNPCCDPNALATAAATVQVANFWSDPVIDFTHTSGSNWLTQGTQTQDSVHPSSEAFIHTWAPRITQELLKMW